MQNPIEDEWNNKQWYNEKGICHREDGPAVEWRNGDKEWYINGLRHREDGPAMEYANGTKIWYINGECHRLDGPAIEWYEGDVEWYYHDKFIKCSSLEEFEKLLKLRMFW